MSSLTKKRGKKIKRKEQGKGSHAVQGNSLSILIIYNRIH